MPNESLKFKIGLSGIFWDNRPNYSILVDDQQLCQGTITGAEKEIQYLEFTADIEEDREHTLLIRLENKTNRDTVQNDDKSAIIKDMLLNIDSIEIDEVDVGSLKWTNSEFVLDNPVEYNGQRIERMQNCVTLGMNGSYQFKFNSPFYLWLLENL